MPSADSSLAQLYYIEESTFGEVPSGPPTLKALRYTGESLEQTTGSTESQEIRSDRQVPDLIRNQVGAQGDVNVEMSYGAHDDLLAGAFMDDWSAAVDLSGEEIDVSSALATVCTYTDQNVSADAFAGIEVGMWVRFGGFTNSGNNGYKRVTAKASDASITCVGDAVTANETGETDITIEQGGFLEVGTTKKSFVIEKLFSDVSEYESYVGMRVGQLELNVATGAIVTGRFGFVGLGATPAGATVGDGSPTAAATNEVFNAIDNVQGIREGYSPVTLDLQSLSFTLNNNTRPQAALGSAQAVGIGIGRALIQGSIRAYFETRDIMESYTNFTASDFTFRLEDAAGNAYYFDMPQLKYSQGRRVIGGIDQDIIADMQFTAYLEPTSGKSLTCSRIPA